jgi:hypothetical protein
MAGRSRFRRCIQIQMRLSRDAGYNGAQVIWDLGPCSPQCSSPTHLAARCREDR